jgi:hypothetical protein
MDAMVREHPQYTRGLRANTFMLEPSKTREFERAMAELQGGLWIVKTEERYEPTFSYRWDLLESWLPDAVTEGRRLSRERAVDRLLERYLRGAVYSRAPLLRRLFGLASAELSASITRLVRGGVFAETTIGDHGGEWLLHRQPPRDPRRARAARISLSSDPSGSA